MTDHAKEAKLSEKIEMDLFFEQMRSLYRSSLSQTAELYDRAFALTSGFQRITANSILSDTRIIKVLRYAMEPALSQMKFGQLVGLSSTSELEESALPANRRDNPGLRDLARTISVVCDKYLERSRFPWLAVADAKSDAVLQMAKAWTCSLAANQNAATEFRNSRKEMQEAKATAAIESAGYRAVRQRATISRPADLPLGTYSRECKIRGKTTQKADIAVRVKSGRLLLLEAKAIGVRVDSFKRVKECREKASDWRDSIEGIDAGVVIAGFVDPTQLASLEHANISIFWEHRLDKLTNYLKC